MQRKPHVDGTRTPEAPEAGPGAETKRGPGQEGRGARQPGTRSHRKAGRSTRPLGQAGVGRPWCQGTTRPAGSEATGRWRTASPGQATPKGRGASGQQADRLAPEAPEAPGTKRGQGPGQCRKTEGRTKGSRGFGGQRGRNAEEPADPKPDGPEAGDEPEETGGRRDPRSRRARWTHNRGSNGPPMGRAPKTKRSDGPPARRVTTLGQEPTAPWGLRGSPPQNNDDRPGESGAATEQGQPEVVLPTGFEPALPP